MKRARAEQKYHLSASDAVKATIAHALLTEPNEVTPTLGEVVLQAHQREGAARLRATISRAGGALLADEVGLGKTYTALAVAREYRRIEIVAPATLRAMWEQACARCEVPATFRSSESLSRQMQHDAAADIVVVDEAHWFRNTNTKRYRRLAQRCRGATVLLLSATPLHNRPEDVTAVLALFLGPRVRRMKPNEITALVVRRGRGVAEPDAQQRLPRAAATTWHRMKADRAVVAALNDIQAPVPPRDAGLAMALLRLTLLRRYASSDAALRATLQRMLARALALTDALRGGSFPTARELTAWLLNEDHIQLALPGLLSDAAPPNEALTLDTLERHVNSVRAALATLRGAARADQRRAALLRRIVRNAGDAPVVAFSQFDATVRALQKLLPLAGVAVLTGSGGRIATGRTSRAAVLSQLDASSRAAVPAVMRVRLLLATDLLSEGVNLHNAKTVVHLDVPWTAARLEQRVGRLCRMGSPHQEVDVIGFAPPNVLEKQHRVVSRLRAKWLATTRRFGSGALLSRDALLRQRAVSPTTGHSADGEALCAALTAWLGNKPEQCAKPVVASLAPDKPSVSMALALLYTPKPRLVSLTRTRVSSATRHVLRAVQALSCCDESALVDARVVGEVIARLQRYLANERGRSALSDEAGRQLRDLLRRITQATRQLPRAERALGLRFAGDVRTALSRVRSAGDLAAFEEVAARARDAWACREPLRWLTELRDDIWAAVNATSPRPGSENAQSRVAAILICT